MVSNLRRDRLMIIYLCFFVSGIAGLIYEILWNKYLALFIGSTGRAHVMTLAVFMGGLALGSWVFGRRVDRIRNPLGLYIALELGIGLLGLAYPVLFEPYRTGFIAIARALGLSASALMAAKLLFCALTVLVPTFLMGGTLPVLGRYLVDRLAEVAPRVATLYYVNTFGAFAGCLLAGFVMIPAYGLHASMALAALLNFSVCALAGMLFQKKYLALEPATAAETPDWQEEAIEGPSLDGALFARTASAGPALLAPAPVRFSAGLLEADTETDTLYQPSMRAIVLATIGLSGFAAMLYEIAWIRLLTLVLGASTYSFSLMVATFIFGIGLGSLLLSRKRAETGYDAVYCWAELGLGLSVLAMLPLMPRVPFWFNQLATLFVREPYAFGPYMGAQMLICFLLMLAPTVLLGATLPAASRIVTERVSRLGRRVGTLYALNTVGTLLGASVAGLILLPAVGLKRTIEIGILVNLAIGLIVLWRLRDRPSRRIRALATAACVLLFGAYLAGAPDWDRNVLSSGIYRQRGRLGSYREMLDMLARRDAMLYYKDGVDASIAVVQSDQTLSLLINGKADASNSRDMSTQILLAHYPLLARPDAKEVLVIGVGSGVSAGSALQYPVERVDAVEISREVVEAATRCFAETNLHFADDPRVALHTEDAKTFMLLTPRRYDVIISEPTNPWIAGVAGLFSKEFYETCRAHLQDDGLIVQWLHIYEIQDAALLSVLKTFTETFPYYTIWNMNALDIAIVGSARPFEPDFAWMEQMFERPGVRRDLERIGLGHPLAVLATQMFAAAGETHALYRTAAVNSDFRPYLEYKAPVGFFAAMHADAIKSLDLRAAPGADARLWIHRYRPSRPPTPEQFAAAHARLVESGSLHARADIDWAERWHAACPDDPRATAAWIAARIDLPAWQRERLREAVVRFPVDAGLADLRARVLVRMLAKDPALMADSLLETREAVERARALHPGRDWLYDAMLVAPAWHEGNMADAAARGARALPHLRTLRSLEGAESTFETLRMTAEAALAAGQPLLARQCLEEMETLAPRDLRTGLLAGRLARGASAEGTQAP